MRVRAGVHVLLIIILFACFTLLSGSGRVRGDMFLRCHSLKLFIYRVLLSKESFCLHCWQR